MLDIRKLNKEDLLIVYPYMEEDFPDNERKSLKMIQDGFDTGFMEGYGLYEEDKLMAYALFVCYEDMRLFDYLAVVKEQRDTGIGSKFLSLLQDVYQDRPCVIGEVENPDYCDDEEEKLTMNRRIDFYLRNGFHDTGATGCVYGVEYKFLEMGIPSQHDSSQARQIMSQFYHCYWPLESNYQKYVQMHEED